MSRPGLDDVVMAMECCGDVLYTVEGAAARKAETQDPRLSAIFGDADLRGAKSPHVREWAQPGVEHRFDRTELEVRCPHCEATWVMTREFARRLAAQVRHAYPRQGREFRRGIRVCIPLESAARPRSDTPSDGT